MQIPSFSIILIICAIVSRILFHNTKASFEKITIDDTIFVMIVSYKDQQWLDNVSSMFNSARFPQRIFFGIMEYVSHPSESKAEDVPERMRNHVRVLTHMENKTSTLAKSRKIILDNLFRNEKYIMATRSIDVKHDWDEYLCQQYMLLPSQQSVLTSHLQKTSVFAKIKEIDENLNFKFALQPLFNHMMSKPISSIVCSHSFIFCLSEYKDLIVKDDTDVGISALLHSQNVRFYYTQHSIGTRSLHPRGVRSKTKTIVGQDVLDLYLTAYILDGNETLNNFSKNGLSRNFNRNEAMAKYGSLKNANLALELSD
jgi:hypothetical protein